MCLFCFRALTTNSLCRPCSHTTLLTGSTMTMLIENRRTKRYTLFLSPSFFIYKENTYIILRFYCQYIVYYCVFFTYIYLFVCSRFFAFMPINKIWNNIIVHLSFFFFFLTIPVSNNNNFTAFYYFHLQKTTRFIYNVWVWKLE